MATEMWGVQSMVTTTGQVSGGTVSNSRRPVSAIDASGSGVATADKAYTITDPWTFKFATPAQLKSNPTAQVAAASDSSLDFVGRNHGALRRGTVQGDTPNRNDWDLRKSNFLYVDGHVEPKHVSETIYPKNQWGAQFYSLTP